MSLLMMCSVYSQTKCRQIGWKTSVDTLTFVESIAVHYPGFYSIRITKFSLAQHNFH